MMGIDVGSFGMLQLTQLDAVITCCCFLTSLLTARTTAKDVLVGLKGCRLREEIFINLRDRRRVGMGSLDVRGLGYDMGLN